MILIILLCLCMLVIGWIGGIVFCTTCERNLSTEPTYKAAEPMTAEDAARPFHLRTLTLAEAR